MSATRRAGRSRSLSVDQIVEAALKLADDDGLSSLSMPKLARSLGCGVMTLYVYVRDKDHLLELMSERMFDLDVEDLLRASGWESCLEAYSSSIREHFTRFPAAADLLRQHRFWSPKLAQVVESMLERLTADGWTIEGAVRAYRLVQTYTLGFVLYETRRSQPADWAEYQRWWRHALADLPVETFPLLHQAADVMPQGASSEQYLWGRERILRGLRDEFAQSKERSTAD